MMMRFIALILSVSFSLVGYIAEAKENNEDYKIVVACDKKSPKVHVIVIEHTCYIFDKQNVNAAVVQSKIDPKSISNIVIYEEGGSEEWKKFTSLLKEYDGRISSVVIIKNKK
jgi:hypothetical protein